MIDSGKKNSLQEKKGWHAFILCLLTTFLLGNSNSADNSVLLPLGGMSISHGNILINTTRELERKGIKSI